MEKMLGVLRFRKKPVEIEAVQLNWKNWDEVKKFLGDIIGPYNSGRYSTTYSDTCGESDISSGVIKSPGWIELTIPTLEGDHIARHGDWIIKGVNGEFYPCKPDIFAKTYELVKKDT